jgi:hypothetical protein
MTKRPITDADRAALANMTRYLDTVLAAGGDPSLADVLCRLSILPLVLKLDANLIYSFYEDRRAQVSPQEYAKMEAQQLAISQAMRTMMMLAQHLTHSLRPDLAHGIVEQAQRLVEFSTPRPKQHDAEELN